MVKEGRAIESPVTHLATLSTEVDRRRIRGALTQDEARKLLTATFQAKPIYSMKGTERALLYRLAIETGLRAGELRSLTAESFAAKSRTIIVQAAHSKRRHKDTIIL
jgi:integrase